MNVPTDRGDFVLSQGEYIILSPEVFHAMNPYKSATLSTGITFSAENINDELITLKPGKLTEEQVQYLNTIVKVYAENYMDVEHNTPLPAERSFGAGQLIKNNLENILISITQGRLMEIKVSEKKSKKSDSLAQIICNYLDEHFTEQINVVNMSTALGYSKGHICQVFKEKYGITIITYVLQRRIQKAMELFESETEPTAQSIAEMLGFVNEYYFVRTFKRFTGMTVRQYRLSVKNNHVINSRIFFTPIE